MKENNNNNNKVNIIIKYSINTYILFLSLIYTVTIYDNMYKYILLEREM